MRHFILDVEDELFTLREKFDYVLIGANTPMPLWAAVVRGLARGRSTKPLKGKLAIAEAYNVGLRKGFAFGEVGEFKKRLAEAAREGLVELERCDLEGALPKELLEASAPPISGFCCKRRESRDYQRQ